MTKVKIGLLLLEIKIYNNPPPLIEMLSKAVSSRKAEGEFELARRRLAEKGFTRFY